MAKLTTIVIPCEGDTREMTGTVAVLPVCKAFTIADHPYVANVA